MTKYIKIILSLLFSVVIWGTSASAIGAAGGMYPPQKTTPKKITPDQERKRTRQTAVPNSWDEYTKPKRKTQKNSHKKTYKRLNGKNKPIEKRSVPGIGDAIYTPRQKSTTKPKSIGETEKN